MGLCDAIHGFCRIVQAVLAHLTYQSLQFPDCFGPHLNQMGSFENFAGLQRRVVFPCKMGKEPVLKYFSVVDGHKDLMATNWFRFL